MYSTKHYVEIPERPAMQSKTETIPRKC